MSRPIKFRAWDFSSEKMKYEVTLDPNGKVAAFSTLTGSYVRGFSDDEMKLMQFTGLCDRNGREIYEGDICEGEQVVYLIKWGAEMAQYQAKVIKTQSVLTKNCPFPLWQYVEGDGKCSLKVIGNIYEHPHLLKGEGAHV